MNVLTVEGDPRRHFYRDARDLDELPEKEARLQLLAGFGEFTSEADGENSNLTVRLVDSTETAEELSVPPLGAAAVATTVLGTFTGLVQSVTLSDDGATLSIEA